MTEATNCKPCSQLARRQSLARAGKKYQDTEKGKANHRARQQLYLERQETKMTHHGSLQPEEYVMTPIEPFEQEPQTSLEGHDYESDSQSLPSKASPGRRGVMVEGTYASVESTLGGREPFVVSQKKARAIVCCDFCGRSCGPTVRFGPHKRGRSGT